MVREALLAARLLCVFLGVSFILALVLVLVGASGHAGVQDVLRGAALAMGAAFGGHGAVRVGGATLAVTASPLLIAFLPGVATWAMVRRRQMRLEWIGAAAVCAGLAVFGLLSWVNGWRGLSVNAAGSGAGAAVVLVGIGGLGWSAGRWPFIRRPLDLIAGAALGLVVLGLATELICGLTSDGGGSGRVPVHTQIALAIAYAPNAGVAALALGLGGAFAVTGISSQYFAFVGRFAGDGPVALFGAPHGEGPWADALHLPGLVSVFVLAPIFVLAVAWSARRLDTRRELAAWALGLAALVVGSAFAAVPALSVDYDGFVLGGSLDATWWGRLAGLNAIPLGVAAFVLTRSAGQPRLDVGDGTRELSREVS